MRRSLSIFFVPLLLGIVIFTSGCDTSTSTVTADVTCFGNIAVKVVASVLTDNAVVHEDILP